MFNKKKKQILELKKEIDWKTNLAHSRQETLTNSRIENDKLIAETVRLKIELSAESDHIKCLENENERLESLCLEEIKRPLTRSEMTNIETPWILGEPRKIGWYFVAHAEGTTALYYNPAARCRWMRGEKGNAERFEQAVTAYMEVPKYES